MSITDSLLYKEIHEQPESLERFIRTGLGPVRDLAKRMQAENIRQVVIAARGTSDNAGRYAQYLLGLHNRLLVTLSTPSLFSIYRQPPDLRGMLVLGISQSGQSPDLVAVLEEANRQGAVTAAITNHADSAMAQQAGYVIPLLAGPERSLAATKTYTAQLTALAALSALLSGNQAMLSELELVPAAVAAILERQAEVERIAERYRYMERCVTIGRGLNYATAFELSLKLKELTYTVAEPYSSADFLHGPLAVVDPGFPVFLIAPRGVILPELKEFLVTLTERRAEVITISNDDEINAQASRALPLPVTLSESLSPLAAIVPGQLFSMYLASTRGIAVDHPRGLSKVTETW